MSNKLRCYPRRRVPGLAEKTVRLAASPIEANHADLESRFVLSVLCLASQLFSFSQFCSSLFSELGGMAAFVLPLSLKDSKSTD